MNLNRLLLLCGAWLLAALAAGCGGGGGVDTGGTGAPMAAFSSGRISGFGSIVVNGVHFDETPAVIVDDEGVVHPADALRLGMTVDIEAGPIQAVNGKAVSTARRIQFGSDIKGPVAGVDTGTGTLVVLEQTVRVDVNTVFDGFGGSLASVQSGDLVEVYAFFDPTTAVYTATRIERKTALAAYTLRGAIANLDTAGETFAIGGATIGYAGIPDAQVPALENGAIARVQLQAAPQSGQWIATRISTVLPGLTDGIAVQLEGHVANFASLSAFRVKGITVDASGPVVFTKGTAAQILNGARIEVEGHMQGGVLVAEQIAVKKAMGGGRDDEEEFGVDGRITSVNDSAQSFMVRGVTVTFDAGTQFTGGARADLLVGARVEVEGVLSGGQQLRAERIRFVP
jgi:hypothetical protein